MDNPKSKVKSASAVILFLAFLALYVITMGGHLYSPDEEIMFLTTKAIAEEGTLAIEPHESLLGFATRRGHGRLYAQYGVGQPLLAVPFYLFGRALASWVSERPIGLSVIRYHNGTVLEEWERFGVSLFNLVVAALLATLLFALVGDLTGDHRAAVMTAVLYGAGTIAWVHSKPFFSETLATLCVFSSFALLVRARLYGRPRWLTLAGIAAGYSLLVRLDSLFAFPGLAVLLLWPDPPAVARTPADGKGRNALVELGVAADRLLRDRATWQRIGRFAPPVALACVIILGLNAVRFGSPFSTGYEDQPEGIQFVNPLPVGLYGFLFSVGKGLFFFSPPLVLFFWSIRRFTRQWPPAGWAAVVIIASLLIVHAKWRNWAGGWCWGPRHIFMVHVFLALPICALLTAPRRLGIKIAYAVLLTVGIGVQIYGTSQSFMDFYHVVFQDPLTPPTATLRYKSHKELATLAYFYEVRIRENPLTSGTLSGIRISPAQMLAPVNDSVWRIDNSQWVMYWEMMIQGFHDYFWLDRLGHPSQVATARDHLREMMQPPDAPPKSPKSP